MSDQSSMEESEGVEGELERGDSRNGEGQEAMASEESSEPSAENKEPDNAEGAVPLPGTSSNPGPSSALPSSSSSSAAPRGTKRPPKEDDVEREETSSAREPPHSSSRREVTTLGIPNSFRSELYFLIAEFLSTDEATSKSAAALREELSSEGKSLLQPRYDWTGRPHPKTYSDVSAEMAQLKLPSDHLLKLCFRLSASREVSAGTRTLLGRPRDEAQRPKLAWTADMLRRQQSGMSRCSPRQWFEKSRLTSGIRKLRRTLGHLSSVYCLIFDRTGMFAFTGADDLLVKCWRVEDGRLTHTFRGMSSEISDLAISHDNRLLAAGSCDKIIRVWCLRSGAPLAILAKHTGMITAIHFCPFLEVDDSGAERRYLASTSGDGTVSFWRYGFNEHDTAVFDESPTRYHEKIRPGQAQIICASFSPGGVFFCCGSADHHVRVYQMNASEEGPVRILEEEAHDDRVDSIQWCNSPDLRFVSGSKDGTARIWSFRRQKWVSMVLNMSSGDNRERPNALPVQQPNVDESAGPRNQLQHRQRGQQQRQRQQQQGSSSRRQAQLRQQHEANAAAAAAVAEATMSAAASASRNGTTEKRVTMVAWSTDDAYVITAVSDKTLRVWDSRSGKLHASLSGHEDEIFVLEPHPVSPNILLSSAHDGYIMIWNLITTECLFRHRNIVDVEQTTGHAAVYDAKWSPNGLSVCASDSHGHLIFLGHGSSEKFDRLPVELFFHTDYRPLLRDSYHNVVDEQTQVPPHLLPPPFLVDSEGSPYPAYIQKAVPGRENMSERDALLPGAPEPSFNMDNQQQQQQQQQEQQQQPQQGNEPRREQAPPAPFPVQLPAGGANNEPVPGPSRQRQIPPQRVSPDRSDENSGPEFRLDRNLDPGQQREQQEAAGQQQQQAVTTAASVKVILRKNDLRGGKMVSDHLQRNETLSILESNRYSSECKKEWSDHDYASPPGQKGPKDKKGRAKNSAAAGANQRRGGGRRNAAVDEEEDEDDDDDENAANGNNDDGGAGGDETSDCSLDESDLSSAESTTDVSMDHSDWGSDDSQDAPMPQEESHRQRRSATAGADASSMHKKRSPRNKKKRSAAQRCRENMLNPTGDISEEYQPSPWLSEPMPRKSPYFPQMGDVLVYFKQGHERYLDLVRSRKVYNVNMKEQEWMKRKHIADPSIVRVLNVNFVLRPPRLAVLRLALLNPHTLEASGETFTIKYHDMNDVVDFLVLYNTYKASTSRGGAGGISGEGRAWKNGDRIRCMIDDCWWKGTVHRVEYHDANKRSPFLSIFVHWDNGEKENLSPWDVEALSQDNEKIKDGTPVTEEQLKAINLYQPTDEEWNGIGRETDSRRISEALSEVMQLAIAEPFNYPVDVTAYPEYMLDIEYPMDLSLIKARLDNRFYRRTDAIEYDVGFIYSNAASFNKPKSMIVKNAKVIMRTLMQIVRDPSKNAEDVSGIYHREVESFEWSSSDESDDDNARLVVGESSRRRRRKSSSSKASSSPRHLNPKKWKHDCVEMLNEMVQLPCSYPFREPVSDLQFPDYHRCINTPMDLSTVRESLMIGDYSSPVDFEKDVRLIFKNSKEYNTEPRSKILAMTDKLEEWFNENFPEILRDFKKVRSKLSRKHHKSKRQDRSGSRTSASPSPSKGKGKGKGKGQSNKIRKKRRVHSESDEEDDFDGHETEGGLTTPSPAPSMSRRRRLVRYNEGGDEDDDDDEEEVGLSKSRAAAVAKQRPAGATRREDGEASGGSRPPRTLSSSGGAGARSSPDPSPTRSSPSSSSSMLHGRRRFSSRVPKPPARYRDDINDGGGGSGGEEDAVGGLVRRRSGRQAGVVAGVMKEEESDAEEDFGASAAAELGEGSSSTRPRRQRKPLRSACYKYEDEDSDAPATAATSKAAGTGSKSPTPKKTPTKDGGEKRKASPPSKADSAPAKRKRIVLESDEDDEDEDDVPLARKLGAKSKQQSPVKSEVKTEEPKMEPERPATSAVSAPTASSSGSTNGAASAAAVSPSKRPIRAASLKKNTRDDEEEFKAESGEEESEEETEETEEDSDDDAPLRRRKANKGKATSPKKRVAVAKAPSRSRPPPRAALSEDEDEEEDEDDEDFDPKGKRRGGKKSPSKRQQGSKGRRGGGGGGGYKNEYDESSDFIADDSDDEDLVEEDEEESDIDNFIDDDSDEEVPLRRRRSKEKSRSRPQRRATLQPKRNSSRRAAEAIDSETERTSTRRPSRMTSNRRGAGAAADTDADSRGGRKRRAAGAKKSYFEGDDDDDGDAGGAGEEEGNRRPRRAASKKARFRDSDDDSDDGEPRGRPNPRII